MGLDAPLNVFIGYDSREAVCSYVAAHSIIRRTFADINIHHLNHRDLRKAGLFKRPWIVENTNGESIDAVDGKKFSTEFSHTRFLVPHLMHYKGWALFMDADMIFLSDIRLLFELCDNKYAVMCVKHSYPPQPESTKMDGRLQQYYYRKNWSSFVLWNCAHPANAQITPEKVNFLNGLDMHSFNWLDDSQIGSLPFTYNYISGISPKLPTNFTKERGGRPDVMHYTNGGPWFDECQDVLYADWWIEEYEDWQRNGDGNRYSSVPTTRYEQ